MKPKAILFYQKPFTAETEQMGCYYFNILNAVLQCKALDCQIVPPLLPLCPRDNTKVEKQPEISWSSAILTIGEISSDKVLEYSKVPHISLSEFIEQSKGRVRMQPQSLSFRGQMFYQDETSEYWIQALPGRWDTEGNDPNTFFCELYSMLPLHQHPLSRTPPWFVEESKKPFLGVHWRRGDRGNYSLGPIALALWNSTQPEQVANEINRILAKNSDLEWVYVSTNSGSEKDRQTLQRLVKKPLRYLERDTILEPLDIWQWDICDLLLCSQAKYLLLSPGGLLRSSAFGRLMIAQNYLNHPTDALNSFMPIVQARVLQ